MANRKSYIIWFTVLSIVAAVLLPARPQPVAYHNFADHRAMFGVANFLDVASNIGFLLTAIAGLAVVLRPRTRFEFSSERWPYALFFLGMLLTAVGSAYYHLAPDNERLFWDRLPMTIAFAGVLAAAVEERIDARAGRLLLWPLVVLGVISLLVWRWTGDLRLYGWVQFFPVLALPLMFLLLKPKYTGTMYWIIAAGWYAFAKVLEFADSAIYSAGHLLSGHTLKHLAAAAATCAILRYYQTRRPIG
jgi:hypothetical protein